MPQLRSKVKKAPTQKPKRQAATGKAPLRKKVIEILDTKYDKTNLPAIVRDNCSHLTPLQQEKLLSLVLK